MKDDNSPKANIDVYDRPERFEWLISELDKQINLYSEKRQSMNRKATWTLATATGFAILSGLTGGPTLSVSLREGVSSYDAIVIFGSILFGLAYLALLKEVLDVYRPQSVLYPVSLFNFEVTGPIDSQQVDSGEFATKCWKEVLERFIKPQQKELHHNTLFDYIDVLADTHLLHETMASHLNRAFNLLSPLAVLSLAIAFLA